MCVTVPRFTIAAVLGGLCLALTGCQSAPPPQRRDGGGVNVRVDREGNVSVKGGDTRVNVRTSEWRASPQ